MVGLAHEVKSGNLLLYMALKLDKYLNVSNKHFKDKNIL